MVRAAAILVLLVLAGIGLIGMCSGPEMPGNGQTWVLIGKSSYRAGPAAPPRIWGERVAVPSDPGAAYRLLHWSRLPNGNVEAVTRRDGRSGTSFARREIDCGARSFRYLGEGDTMNEALADSPGPGGMDALTEGSVSAHVSQIVCSRALR